VGGLNIGRMVVQESRARGLLAPEDVAIITGYNEPAICEQPPPSLTSIELGASASATRRRGCSTD
jgi:DNA-binding LacI/PurR family transcriptional regulator